MGIEVMPWIRLAHVELGDDEATVEERLNLLVQTASQWGCDTILPNYENEAGTISPHTVRFLLDKTGWRGDTGWSTQGWLPNDVDYSPINDDPVLLQMFPADMRFDPAEMKQKIEDCVWHARVQKGFTYVGITEQTYGNALPTWYDQSGSHSVFPGNVIPHGEWHLWFP